MEWYELTALQLGEKIRAGEVSAVEAAQAALDRMAALQPDNNAFITTLADHAPVSYTHLRAHETDSNLV